jgi:HAD superfamily hydrolase (TIGR01662 family)
MMATRSITSIFFDLGFTLINFEGDFNGSMRASYVALAASLIESGCQVDLREFTQKYHEIISDYYKAREADLVEKPVEDQVQKTLDLLGHGKVDRAILTKAVEAMFRITEAYWQVEADTHHTLASLRSRGFQLGLISNASDLSDLNRLVDNSHLREYFKCIVVSSQEKIRKPNVRIYEKALRLMNAKPENAVMVGDTLIADILGAQNAGLRTVWITRRANRAENNSVISKIIPDKTIGELTELIPVLDAWRN